MLKNCSTGCLVDTYWTLFLSISQNDDFYIYFSINHKITNSKWAFPENSKLPSWISMKNPGEVVE